MSNDLEQSACIPEPVHSGDFNPSAVLPYGLAISHVRLAMEEFISFLGFINGQLHSRQMERLESMLMPANFSSIVGEFMSSTIPKYCPGLVKNSYHNGHPDMLPAGMFLRNAAQHVSEGIVVKSSRYLRGWQGHNPEDVWLLVFVFDNSRPVDIASGVPPRPFRFVKVVGNLLTKADWTSSGRSLTSRRTITATVNDLGYEKLTHNWIYQSPGSGSV